MTPVALVRLGERLIVLAALALLGYNWVHPFDPRLSLLSGILGGAACGWMICEGALRRAWSVLDGYKKLYDSECARHDRTLQVLSEFAETGDSRTARRLLAERELMQ